MICKYLLACQVPVEESIKKTENAEARLLGSPGQRGFEGALGVRAGAYAYLNAARTLSSSRAVAWHHPTQLP